MKAGLGGSEGRRMMECIVFGRRPWMASRLVMVLAVVLAIDALTIGPVSARSPVRTPLHPAPSAATAPAAPLAPAPAVPLDATATPPPAVDPTAIQTVPAAAVAATAATPTLATIFGAVPVPVQPQDPRLAQVFAIFDSGCAQCHQAGKLSGPGAAGGVANILDLAALAREPHLIRRGEPDASRLYQVMLDRHHPLDLGSDLNWPGADEIARVRTWIEEIPLDTACEKSAKISADDVAKAIDAAVVAAGEAAAQELRFVTLTHLANACTPRLEMEAYRQGVAKLLNSLSWGAQPIAPVAIDEAKTVLAFKLSDIGWVDEHWNALARAEPKAFALDLAGQIKAPGANTRPIRGDWLAHAAAQPPYYGELLGLPPTLDETARLLGISRHNDANSHGIRAAIRTSSLTRGPRVIERHQADTRRMWMVYDFADSVGEHDVFERPLGGVKGAPEKSQFRADAVRVMFGLPNGFLGYGLFEPDGHRIEQLPQRLETDPAHSAGVTVAGSSCLSCHTAGLKPFSDAMRNHVTSEKFTGPREVKDQTLALYETANEWARVLDEDGYRYRRALIQAGIDPDLTVHGLEPIAALAKRYDQGVDLASAAAEAAMTPEAFDKALSQAQLTDRALALRLREGLLSRAEINSVLAAINAKVPTDQPGIPTIAGAGLKLALWTDSALYKPGDLMTVYARPSAPCHLTLISVNTAGKATVLFPSEFDPDNLVRPDAPLTLPGDKAHYQFRLKETGAESIIAQCQTVQKFPTGIEPDYDHQRFTVLGSYENFLRTSYGLEGEAARTRKAKPAGAKDAKDAKDEQTARSAVRIIVR